VECKRFLQELDIVIQDVHHFFFGATRWWAGLSAILRQAAPIFFPYHAVPSFSAPSFSTPMAASFLFFLIVPEDRQLTGTLKREDWKNIPRTISFDWCGQYLFTPVIGDAEPGGLGWG
jgi:hypothetical protein